MLSSAHPVAVKTQIPSSPTAISTRQMVTKAVLASGAHPSAHAVSHGVAHLNGAQVHSKLHDRYHHIWLVTGPAGTGKTTIAKSLAKALDLPYIEGDNYHSKSNVEKMANNIPLTDADRWDWLTALRDEAMRQIHAGKDGVVVTCSALKRKYRDVIRVAPYFDPTLKIHFIYPDVAYEIVMERVQKRKDHYMQSSMVDSQFAILEPPQADEDDVIVVDGEPPIDEVSQEALRKIRAVLEKSRS